MPYYPTNGEEVRGRVGQLTDDMVWLMGQSREAEKFERVISHVLSALDPRFVKKPGVKHAVKLLREASKACGECGTRHGSGETCHKCGKPLWTALKKIGL